MLHLEDTSNNKMPGKVKVKIIAGRNLPVMDRSSDTTDAYVEIKLGNTTYKTDVCRKSLNPQWNSEWYRFEVDDSELQDEPLQIRLMDHDTYSANDAIGKVYLNLNPLIIPSVGLPGKYGEPNIDQPSSSVMSGWIPVYDTMHGIRGEVNVTVKVELFSDFNKFRQSSCGVQFFCSPVTPHGYHAQVILGFIEELVVNDDPEYHWIDKIRTPRASNEARQTLFFKLSGELQRKIGVKALELGGNAVIGYNQCFDLEGESGIVARGIGTVVTLVKHHEIQQQLDIGIAEEKARSYLKFLAFDNGLKLENDNIFERFSQSSPIPNSSVFVSTPDNVKEQFIRLTSRKNIPTFLWQSSQPLIEYEPLPTNLKSSVSSRSLSDDIKEELVLKQLLRQEEMRGAFNTGLSRKIKFLKQNMLLRKRNVFKTKLPDSVMQETFNLNTGSISSAGESNPIRTSLIDLRELRKKKKQGNYSFMAELLVKSVIQAHTSLDCIAESHDSGPASVSNEELEDNASHRSTETQKTVHGDAAVSGLMNKTISEPYLLLPDNTIITSSSNGSSSSELSSSDASDTQSEIKDDKLDFDTVSLIVKNVQNETYEQNSNIPIDFEFFRCLPATAPILSSNNNNLFEFSADETKVENAKDNIDKVDVENTRSMLTRALSLSCTNIVAGAESKCDIENNKSLLLPCDIEKRIDKLRHSALFRSFAERPVNKLNKTFSISYEDVACNSNETEINLKELPKKSKLNKTFSVSCEHLNLAEIEKRIEKLQSSAIFSMATKKTEPRKRGKLTRSYSVSSNDNIEATTNSTDIQQRNETLSYSSLFNDTVTVQERRNAKINRALSSSCENFHFNEKTGGNTNALSTNAERKIDLFKNSKLFKISIAAEPGKKGKLTRTLSRSHANISTNKHKMYEEKSDINNADLVKTAMHTILTEKINLLTPQPVPISPRAEEQLFFQNDPDIGNNSLIKTAMQTMLMEKIDLMTTKAAPVSKRVKEEFQKNVAHSISKSNPDLSNILVTNTVHSIQKVHTFLKKSPTYLKKLRNDYNDNLKFKSDSNLNETRSTINESPNLSQKFITEPHKTKTDNESHLSSQLQLNNNNKIILLDKTNVLTSPISSEIEQRTLFTNQENNTLQYEVCPRSPEQLPVYKLPHVSENNLFQTMLLDEINIIPPTSPSVLPQHESKSSRHPNLDKIKTTVTTVLDKVHILSPKLSSDKKFFSDDKSDQSLMKTAMNTMLLDKVNILASNATPPPEEEFVFDDSQLSPSKHDAPKLDKVKTVVHNVFEKVSNLSPKSPTSAKSNKTFDFNENAAEPSLMKTAMQTMLIDKVTILAPASSEAVAVEEEHVHNDSKHTSKLDMVKSAVHNVIETVHNISSPTKDKKFDFANDDLNEESLTKTAMQTMLLDKANIIAPNSPSFSVSEQFQYDEKRDNNENIPVKSKEHDTSEPSLMKSAMQTMLMEKVCMVTPESANVSSPTDTQRFENVQSASMCNTEKKHSILCSLKRKCKSLKPKISFSKFIPRKRTKNKDKEEGMVESAMTTILMDKVNDMQGLTSCSDIVREEDEISHLPEQISLFPTASSPKACDKNTVDINALTFKCTDKPSIIIRPDTGDSSFTRTTAVTADDANYNTNAEHAPCLYTSNRRIAESPISIAERETNRESRERQGHQRTESTGGKMSQSPARFNAIPCIHRRSSDSDLSITPKGNSLTGSDRSGGAMSGYHHVRSTLVRPTVNNFDMIEYPFLTMSKYPPGFILHLGGAVSARSVKLLERVTNIEEPETRDTWWSELRMEIRTHARALNCNVVMGYAESTSICDEVCVLSASGTAAVIAMYTGELSDGVSRLPNLHKPQHLTNKDLMTSSLDRTDFEREKNLKNPDSSNNKITESPEPEPTIEFSGAASAQSQPTSCRICHIPYNESSMSFRTNMQYCSICKVAKVPDILLTTIEMPEGAPITGRGCFLQSYVCRPKRDLKGELNAKEISESLPFLEYELHRLLVNKMKVKSMNTMFGLKVRITIGDKMLIGVATGTAVFLVPLPPPPLPKLISGNSLPEDKKLSEMQKLLVDTVKKNKEIYELKDIDNIQPSKLVSDNEESDDEKSNLDLGFGNKDSCVLEVDDSEDIEVINLLVEPRPPDGFHVVNTENVPGLEELEIVRNLQMFTQVWRAKIPPNQSASHFGKHFQKLLQSVYFKLRRMIPCALCDLQFRVDLPEPDEIQLTLLGMALGLGDPIKLNKYKRKNYLPTKEQKKSDDELIFSLEEDQIPENSVPPIIGQGSLLNPQMLKHRQKSPQRFRASTRQRHTPLKERHGVDITPLSYVPGGKIERYLGYLNFFFIRETTSIREGGGLSGFVHSFITEILAIVRAHVTALGGNAMVSYFMTECVLYHNAHKNQGQCLINVGGDVVFVSYFTEDN